MKFLVPNYSCLQNPWPGGLPPTDPRSLRPLSSTAFVEHTPTRKKILGTPLDIRKSFSTTTDACSNKPTAPAPSTVTWHCTLHSHCKSHRLFICSLKVPLSLGDLSRNILLNKPHVTHIKSYKVTDFKTEIRCGQKAVQQIGVVWQILVAIKRFNTTRHVWLITLWGGGAKWTVATGNFKLRMILVRT